MRELREVFSATKTMLRSAAELGLGGMIFLLLRAYSMARHVYRIEAVSNGLPSCGNQK